MSDLEYNPPPSVVPFLTSPKMASFIVGPVGSTKTTASIMKIAYEAKQMAVARDGLRHSRCVVVRNTREQLFDTTIPDFLRWFPDGAAGSFTKTGARFILRFDDVECEVLFRGLDDSNDVRRLLSLQLSFAMMDEFREINKDIFEALTGRLGRYPDKSMVPPRKEWGVDDKGNPIGGCVNEKGQRMKKVWGATNPPDLETYWETLLTNPPPEYHVTIQPSGLSPKADWIKYLDTNYYEDLMVGKTEDWIDVYINAKFGKSLSGMPVFRSFDTEFHVSKTPLRPILNGMRPVIVGLDFGLTPSAVLGQLDLRGRLLIFNDLTSAGMGVLRFAREKLKPLLNERFPGAPILVVGDPAGVQRVQTDEKTVYDILKSEGFKSHPASTNSIVARINAVEAFLARQVDGGAGFLVDPACKDLIAALRGKYRYKLKQNGEADVTPDKNEASHVSDALQYLALHADADQGGKLHGTRRRPINHVSAIGWT
jgi:hypothetical protein